MDNKKIKSKIFNKSVLQFQKLNFRFNPQMESVKLQTCPAVNSYGDYQMSQTIFIKKRFEISDFEIF